ncbi:MAG: CheR family methyltransferase [Myxococcales bacterium]
MCMSLEEILFDLSKCRVRILGTDISEGAVDAANRAEFSKLEVERGLDTRQVARNFTVTPAERYKVRDELRGLCRFTPDNLLSPRTSGSFDVILCRNVLIDFSAADKARWWATSWRSSSEAGRCSWGPPSRCWSSPTR